MMVHTAPADLEDRFPGRWDARRPVHDSARLLLCAVAGALEARGWWRSGSGEAVAGGLVVAVDRVSAAPADRFARAVIGGQPRSPTDFLFALPSSSAAVVGLCVGLLDYQTTICGLAGAGAQALQHAVDLLRGERLSRVVVAAQSPGSALAYCLDRRQLGDERGPEDFPREADAVTSLLDAYGTLGYE